MYEGVADAFFQNVTVYDAIGVVGVVLYIVAYAALQFGLIIGRGTLYPALNGLAASLVMVSLFDQFHLASAIIQAMWIAISVTSLTRLYFATQRARFSKEEEELLAAKQIHLPSYLSRKLMDLGEWRNAPAGTVLTEQGKPVSHLYYLSKGEAEVTRNDQFLTHLGPKSFVGEIVCLTGEPSLGTVTLTERSRLFSIESGNLKRFVGRSGDIAEALESSIVQEISRKLVEGTSRLRGGASP
ncbi:MAG: cyclic nucleotide-binding domain-containing protein [Pseudomonadota bacterium]